MRELARAAAASDQIGPPMSRRTSVMGRRASVMGIADMNDFARSTVEATLKQNGGACEYWKLQEAAEMFQCDNLYQALRGMKKEKLVAYKPMMLMMDRDRDEIITLVGYDPDAEADAEAAAEAAAAAGEEEMEDDFNLEMMPDIPEDDSPVTRAAVASAPTAADDSGMPLQRAESTGASSTGSTGSTGSSQPTPGRQAAKETTGGLREMWQEREIHPAPRDAEPEPLTLSPEPELSPGLEPEPEPEPQPQPEPEPEPEPELEPANPYSALLDG
jgi:hypothetical protein